MVEQSAVLDGVFHALAHEVRRSMLLRLADADLTVGELAKPLAMSLAAASKHVQVLERAGLVRRTVHGRRHLLRLDPTRLAGADLWLRFHERTWREQLDALDAALRSERLEEDT